MKFLNLKIPAEPTRAMLRGMATATFRNDGSNLEYRRRYNGLLAALRRMRINRAKAPPKMNDVCKNCGMRYGRHRLDTGACPVRGQKWVYTEERFK